MKLLKEGSVSFYLFNDVFYNPLAKFSRTFGVLAIYTFSKYVGRGLVVADSFAASGIRGLRYYVESNVVDKIVFNDKNPVAYQNIVYNIKFNKIKDARVFNLNYFVFLPILGRGHFDVIDIDPYGTPAPYIDLAISFVKNRGLIIITATDLTALCGLYPRAAFRKYGSDIIKTDFCHEVALRVLIKELVFAGGRHNRIVLPLASMFSEQYARIYAYVYDGRRDFPKNNLGYIEITNDRCYSVKRVSDSVNKPYIGPLWIGSLHDKEFIEYMIKYVDKLNIEESEYKRLKSLLKLMKEEIELPPYSFKVSKLASKLRVSPPTLIDIIDRLKGMGFKAGRSHLGKDYFKTNAPYHVVLGVLEDLGKK